MLISNRNPAWGTGGHARRPFIGLQHEHEESHQVAHMEAVTDNQARTREVHPNRTG